jgi:hypothetical protein
MPSFSPGPEPKWQCDLLANAYERARKNIPGCRSMFGASLRTRARKPEAYDEPFEVWRDRYFGPWLQGG